MKIKSMRLSAAATSAKRRSLAGDVPRQERSRDPVLHPHERERELVRATNAAKVERMVSRPFQGSLTGHTDGVCAMSRHATRLNVIFTGACDGEIRQWHVPSKTTISSLPGAHKGWVKGLCGTRAGGSDTFLSCGTDAVVKLWNYGQGSQQLVQDATTTDGYLYRPGEVGTGSTSAVPRATFTGGSPFSGLDCSWGQSSRFVTSGGSLDLWDTERSAPVHTFEWGVDQSTSVRFNPAQHNLLASTGSDRSLILYDARQETPVRRLVTALRANAVAWNPTEPMNLTAACEDSCLHTFDMRKLGIALCTHRGHVSAVLAVDYSPTGREFVSGSYDRTVRIFGTRGETSRDMYHTKRMQRVHSVLFSSDATYVFSGSDDMNVRAWRADASMPTRPLSRRERDKIDYSRKLIERHRYLPDVRKVVNSKPVPAAIKNATQTRKTIRESEKRKDENRRKHGGGKNPRMPERKRNIIAEKK